jgi:hypothetical protein
MTSRQDEEDAVRFQARTTIFAVVGSLTLTAAAMLVGAGSAAADSGGYGPGPGNSGHGAQVLYVSNQHGLSPSSHGNGRSQGEGCNNAQYQTIGAAVAAANPGATVDVCPGTYNEDVVVGKSLTLTGQNATIDAAGLNNGIQVVSPNVTIQGFTITSAIGEGILVGVDSLTDPSAPQIESEGFVLSNETIADNNVVNDNAGFSGPGGSTSTCVYGGDCGGGIHFNVVSHSTITGNHVSGNADGVLLTDDYGPNFDNVVSFNNVSNNVTECGITLPSHNPSAVTYNSTTMQLTGRNPTLGGVYDNKIIDNVADDNGTVAYSPAPGIESGSGAGVGIFGSGPGTGAYDNLVEGNSLSGNGLAGVTIHAHLPGGEDVNGNQIIGNRIGTNNVVGDPEDGVPGLMDSATTGISVYSGVAAVQMTIASNIISNNADGIWINSPPVTVNGLTFNLFIHDVTNVLNAG